MEPVESNTRNVNNVMQYYDNELSDSTARKTLSAAEKPSEQETVIDEESIEKIAKGVDDFLKLTQTNLQVEIHKETHTPIFKIVRKDDNKVIKEVPPRAMLDIAVKVRDMIGSLVDDNA